MSVRSVKTLQHRGLLAVLLALSALAWLVLWQLEGTALSHSHHAWPGESARIAHHAAHGDQARPVSGLFAVAAFAGGWLLMSIAMMLPTTLPLLQIFARLTALRADRLSLLCLLVLGYLSTWTAFGLLAYALIAVGGALLVRFDIAGPDPLAVAAVLLLLCGAFQFSSLKRRCLRECRAPLGFVLRHFVSDAPPRRAFMLGIAHGAFCVGCCWALMLLMFAVNIASLAWMLFLAAIMAVEKNSAGGARLVKPLGALFLFCGAALSYVCFTPLR